MLRRSEPGSSNDPQALREHNEKLSILEFPQFTVPTLVTREAERIRTFWADHEDVIVKPLDIRTLSATGALVFAGRWVGIDPASSSIDKSAIFMVEECPVHHGRLRHSGIDTLFDLLAATGLRLYRTDSGHPWAGPAGIIAPDDVVLIKVNCQWKCRGTTNTDVLQGLIYRILQHPDGFSGEVVIFENGQGQGSFDGRPHAWGSYSAWPEIDNGIYVNSAEETLLKVDYLVNTIFRNDPVSAYLLDPTHSTARIILTSSRFLVVSLFVFIFLISFFERYC